MVIKASSFVVINNLWTEFSNVKAFRGKRLSSLAMAVQLALAFLTFDKIVEVHLNFVFFFSLALIQEAFSVLN